MASYSSSVAFICLKTPSGYVIQVHPHYFNTNWNGKENAQEQQKRLDVPLNFPHLRGCLSSRQPSGSWTCQFLEEIKEMCKPPAAPMEELEPALIPGPAWDTVSTKDLSIMERVWKNIMNNVIPTDLQTLVKYIAWKLKPKLIPALYLLKKLNLLPKTFQ